MLRAAFFLCYRSPMRGVLLALLAAGATLTGQKPDVDRLVAQAAAYIRDYQQQLTAVVADETYTQHLRAQVPRDKGMAPTRTTTSEIFFLHVPGYDWMAMRDVATMDGRPVQDRPDLKDALKRVAAPEVAWGLKQYNSRFNLGKVFRTFNEPTLSLLVLDDRHRDRFRFTLNRTAVEGDTRLAMIGFREIRRPTLIQNRQGVPSYTRGELTIETGTGRIRRALLELTIDTVQISMSTTYAFDERLGIMVPSRFGERYQDGVQMPAAARGRPVNETHPYEEIVCEAKYTNFRRFEVKAIIR